MKKEHEFEFDKNNLSLMEYSNIFATNTIWFESGDAHKEATFDLAVRNLPENWGYVLMFGLDRFLKSVRDFKFSKKDITLLIKMGLIDEKTKKYYENFKFEGDIFSIPDGTPFFPTEPVLRITSPLYQVNLMTALVLNSFSYPIRILTKISRLKTASVKKQFTSGGLVRAPGFEQVVIGLNANYIGGGATTIQPIFYRIHPELMKKNWLYTLNINHATINSFSTEPDAFRYSIKEILPKADMLLVMIDTYDLKRGLQNFIKEIKNLPDSELKKLWIPIDSGDIYKNAIYIRKELDKNNLNIVKIASYSNLEEYKIFELEKKKAPIDFYLAITEVVNVSDAPVLETVFKMSELRFDNQTEYKAKLTKGKESYPARKQIFRVFEKGVMKKDVIGIESEKLGVPLLKQFMKNGKVILETGNLDTTKKCLEKNMLNLPEHIKKIYSNKKFPLEISESLEKLIKKVRKKHV